MPTPRPPVGGSEVSPSERIGFQGNPDRGPAEPLSQELTMAQVQIIQRNAHLAGAVRLEQVKGSEGPIARATLTAISNHRHGRGDERADEPTSLQWVLWGKQAENAAEYLGKGSHVNILGRLRNNNFEKDGEPVYGMAFTAEEVDYLDSRAESEARRAAGQGVDGTSAGTSAGTTTRSPRPPITRQPARV